MQQRSKKEEGQKRKRKKNISRPPQIRSPCIFRMDNSEERKLCFWSSLEAFWAVSRWSRLKRLDNRRANPLIKLKTNKKLPYYLCTYQAQVKQLNIVNNRLYKRINTIKGGRDGRGEQASIRKPLQFRSPCIFRMDNSEERKLFF